MKLRGPIRPSKDLPSEPGFAYHATNEERACDIARSGLRPHGPSYGTDQDAWPDGGTERRSYHSLAANVVYSFAPEEGASVVLRTPLAAHPFKAERYTRDLYTRKTIPAAKIAIATDDAGWVSLVAWCARRARRGEM